MALGGPCCRRPGKLVLTPCQARPGQVEYVNLRLFPNPSHLEAINPVLLGYTHAQQVCTGVSNWKNLGHPMERHGPRCTARTLFATTDAARPWRFWCRGMPPSLAVGWCTKCASPGEAGLHS